MSGGRPANRGRLIVGDLTRDLFAAFRREIDLWRRDDPLVPGVALVGSNLLRLHLARRLALEGTPHAGIRFVTFRDLALALGAQRLAKLASLPPGGRALLARHVAKSGAERAEYFTAVAGCPGFRHRLASTFGDLDDAGFAAAASSLASRWSADDAKLSNVLRFYADYREALDGRFVTTSDAIRLAALDAERFAEAFQCERLALFGFYDFTEVQRRLLTALSSTRVTLTAFAPDPGLPWHDFARASVAFLEGLGLATERAVAVATASVPSVRGAVVPPDSSAKPASPPTLRLPSRLEIVSIPGEVEESREIARMVLRSARNDGVPFREMAVLFHSADTYAAPLREAFEEARIPFYLHQGLPLSETPAGKAFALLLGLGGTNFERSSVIEFLTTAPLARDVIRRDPPQMPPSSWDRASRLAGIVEGRDAWRSRLERLERAPKTSQADQRAAASLRRFVEPFFEDLARTPAHDSWARLTEHWTRLLTRWLAPSPDRDRIAEVIAALAQLDEFREAAREVVAADTEKVGRFGIDCVTLTDLHSARGVPFRVVFIAGVVERSLPSAVTQDPILLDGDREKLNAKKLGALELGRERAREDEMLFALALAGAIDRVVLTCPRFESGTSRVRTPSAFVFRTAKEFYGRDFDSESIAEAPDYRFIPLSAARLEDPESALSEHERRVALALKAGVAERAALAAAFGRQDAGFARRATLLSERAAPRVNEHTGALSRGVVRLVRDAHPLLAGFLSPSAMEMYAACPYKYFLTNVLQIKSTPEPEHIEEMDVLERGSLVHAILRDLYGELSERGLWPLDATKLAAADELLVAAAEQHFRIAADAGVTGYDVLWRLVRARVLAVVRSLLAWEGDEAAKLDSEEWAQTMLLEKSFGDEGLTEVAWPLDSDRKVRFRGRIDRMDSVRGRFVVTDYKVKVSRPKSAREAIDPTFLGGEALQLPVYLLAAKAMLEESGIRNPVGRARYVSLVLADAKVSAAPLESEQFDAMRAAFNQALRTIADGVESGFFPQYPDRGENCRFCDFKRVCGPAVSVERLRLRKSDDPRFVAFLEMKKEPAVEQGDAE
jgi:RecB family exonuclease/predicted TIM-barrel fold metal-dependent hydrolase